MEKEPATFDQLFHRTDYFHTRCYSGGALKMPQPISEMYPLTLLPIAALYRAAVSGPKSQLDYLSIVGICDQHNLKVSGFSNEEKSTLTTTTLLLANNQINEACNKFYATVELANAVKDRTYSGSIGMSTDQFSGEFMLGSLVPVLYYSQVAALLSLFSSYGLIFARDRRTRQVRRSDPELRRTGMHDEYEYLCIRSSTDWLVKSRSQVAGGNKHRFHQQLIAIGERFFATGTDATEFDFNLIQELKAQRELVDYGILGHVSMVRAMGFENYLRFLPRAYKNIKFCIQVISTVGRITNNSDSRMTTLERSALALLFTHPVSIRLNLLAEMPSSFVVNTS